MKFSIDRTTCWSSERISNDAKPPLKDCILEKTTKTVKRKEGYWPDTGLPYYVDKEITVDRWIIEIDSLDKLLKILSDQEYPFIIFKQGEMYPDCPHIEIYDGYRE